MLVTKTCTSQVALAAMVPPDAEMESAPFAGGQAPVRVPQAAEAVAGLKLLTVTPIGRVSVNEKLFNAVSGGAVKVKCRSEFPPMLIVEGVKVFVAVTPAPV